MVASLMAGAPQRAPEKFQWKTTIADIQSAIRDGQITTTGLVELYLKRIKAYNGTCVNEPQGILGPITTIPHAGQINALSTLNLRPAARKAWGFDDRKARSMTDRGDNDPNMPDALEVAAAQDRAVRADRQARRAAARRRDGDQGSVRHVRHAHHVGRRRALRERPSARRRDVRRSGCATPARSSSRRRTWPNTPSTAARSSFGGTFCNPYDTEREPGMSSAGSATSVAANLVTCAIGEETVVSIRWPARGQQPRRPRADAGTREPRRHDGRGPEHARRADLPHRAGRGEDARRDRRLRSEGRADGVQRRPHAGAAVRELRRRHDGSTACASAWSASTWTRSCSPRPTRRASTSSSARSAICASSARRSSIRVRTARCSRRCVTRYAPRAAATRRSRAQYPEAVSRRRAGKPTAIRSRRCWRWPPIRRACPQDLSLRNLGAGAGAQGEGKYMIEPVSARARRREHQEQRRSDRQGDASTRIRTSPTASRRAKPPSARRSSTPPCGSRAGSRCKRWCCSACRNRRLDALVSPMATIPPRKLNGAAGAERQRPRRRSAGRCSASRVSRDHRAGRFHDRSLGSRARRRTARVWSDRLRPDFPSASTSSAVRSTKPLLFRIASAYEAATEHRTPPPEFGPLAGEP